ncbi:MAG: peptidoglycan-binding protein [Stenomitos rutilans HA7619-LM2]|nr:peptidoglycan-binding protein [Stenomitos rutilans HA7619-LM2]
MLLEIAATLLLGGLCFRWGMRFGTLLLRKGSTANDLFKGKTSLSLLFLGLYIGLILLALNVPQMQFLPLEWRVSGMRITWTIMRAVLLGFCGLAYVISWQTARLQVFAVVLIGVLGVTGFSAAEAYFLSPIYTWLHNNLQPNGVYKQTSMSSCAPSALATVLRRWQIDATESGVARLAGTSRLGTSMPQLIMAAHELGMDGTELSPTWEQMQRINRPGVLGVWLIDGERKLPHAVALLAMNSEQVAIGDPARGKIYALDQAQFATIWRQQYVPIFRASDRALPPAQAADYLQRLGYLSQPSQDLSQAIRRFQAAVGIPTTGELDVQTVLLLTGPFLEKVPTLTPQRSP